MKESFSLLLEKVAYSKTILMNFICRHVLKDPRIKVFAPLRPRSVVKGWGGHREGTKFES